MKNQRFIADLGGYQYIPPPDLSILSDKLKAQMSQVEEKKDIVSTWLLKGIEEREESVLVSHFC